MKTYKARIDTQREYEVTREDFELAKLDNPKLYQNGKYYGICPYCDSPVKLVGLEHKIKVSSYAQHTEGNVPNVATKTFKSMYCPVNTHRRTAESTERLEHEDENSLLIKKTFIEQFDVIAKIINNYSDIYYSYENKKQLFKNCFLNKIWLFPLIDQSNIPWIILYCNQAEEIKNKLIKNDSKLFNFLIKQNISLITSTKLKNYSFIDKKNYDFLENMYYSFTFYNKYIDTNDDLKETICAVLSRSNRFNNPPEDGYTEFFKNKIEIDHQELYNKVKYYDKNEKRDYKLLNDIKEIVSQNLKKIMN